MRLSLFCGENLIAYVYSCIVKDLRPLFDKYGDVGDVFLPTERETGRSRGFAFVRYYEKRDAEVEPFLFLNKGIHFF